VVAHQIVDGHFEVWTLKAAAALRANGRSKVHESLTASEDAISA